MARHRPVELVEDIGLALHRRRRYGPPLVVGEDRRIRIVALTPSGKELIAPVFQRHATDLGVIFAELSQRELQQLEGSLKKIGRRAEALVSREKPQNE